MRHTFKYKSGYVHVMYNGTKELTYVQINKYAYLVEVKSVRAAKLFITKHTKETV